MTPIYTAAHPGLMEAFLDVLPQFAMEGKTVLPMATDGSLAHMLALDDASRPVLQSMRARHVVQSHLVIDLTLVRRDEGYETDPSSVGPLFYAALDEFSHSPRSFGTSAAPLNPSSGASTGGSASARRETSL